MKAKKIILALLAPLVLFSFFSCGNKSKLNDGTFTGKGEGRNGPIEVSITVKNGAVKSAAIISEQETEDIGKPVEQPILDKFVRYGGKTKGIDAVSGATITVNGMIQALEDALKNARGEAVEKTGYENTECDIVIIGAGGAGLTAATEAASKKAKVIVLEKMGIVGGNTNSSTGGINASYTKEQERLGITDSPDVFYEDTMKGGKYLNDPDLVRTLVDNSAAMVDWLESDLVGADLSDVGIFGGATNKRIHRPQGGSAIGAHLVPHLYEAALKQGAEIRTNNKVVDILKGDDGKACGVKVEYEGKTYEIRAKAVIVATGGFSANQEMVTKYQPGLAGFATTNHKGATGDAFGLVEKFDAALVQMEQIQTHPTVVPGTGIMITEAVRGNGAILVSRTGKRFINEMETRDVVSAAILAEPGATTFLVFDQSVRDSLSAIGGYEKQSLVTKADTLPELADKLGITGAEAEQFVKTISEYNGFVSAKDDKDFHRNPESMERSLEQAPFYAIEVEPAVHHTMGGIKINTKAQVIDNKGAVVPGLFAAGEVTGGVHGANRLGGNAVADICIFGKISADSALEYAGIAK